MRRGRKAINQMNVVPYIDVMLVLLVIFMVTAPLITGQVELPSLGSKLNVPAQPLEVTVRGQALWAPAPELCLAPQSAPSPGAAAKGPGAAPFRGWPSAQRWALPMGSFCPGPVMWS